jgi:hypothetical protein
MIDDDIVVSINALLLNRDFKSFLNESFYCLYSCYTDDYLFISGGVNGFSQKLNKTGMNMQLPIIEHQSSIYLICSLANSILS